MQLQSKVKHTHLYKWFIHSLYTELPFSSKTSSPLRYKHRRRRLYFCSHRTHSHAEVRVGMHSPPADRCHTHCHACYFRSRYHHWLWLLLYELISTPSAHIHECEMTVCVIFVWLINSSDISCSSLVYHTAFILSFCWESETDRETDTSIMCVWYLFLMSRFFVEYEFPSRSHRANTLSRNLTDK